MADIKTSFVDFAGDWTVLSPGLSSDDGLETAVVISLFTDRRASDDDTLPAGFNRRGWWADAITDIPGDQIGSKLWLLCREKQLPAVVSKAREYALESLQWMIEDGVAQGVNVTAEIVRTGVLGLAVEIVKPDKTVARYRFENFWEGA